MNRDFPFAIRPLERWQGERTMYPGLSPWRAGIKQTRETLRRELNQLQAENIILEIDVRERDIRLDGGLRADASPNSAAIVLTFDSKHGPLRYAMDRWALWEDNLRSIALTLEALRAVTRYGVAASAEQYRGWAALPPPADQMTLDQARDILERNGGFRVAALAHHPDRGGDAIQFRRFTTAKAILAAAGQPIP